MMTLRRKLGEPGPIDTVVGAGYRVSSTSNAASVPTAPAVPTATAATAAE
jgi:DNA-binding winged helix-turn-helix (wHTH) protein